MTERNEHSLTQEDIKKAIPEVINSIMDDFSSQEKQKNQSLIEGILTEFKDLDRSNPEQFTSLLFSTVDFYKRSLVAESMKLLDLPQDRKTVHHIKFLFSEYHFIESHLKSVILKYEGMPCSSDKTRWLLKSYLDYLVKGTLPEVQSSHYYHPDFLDMKVWFDWINTMSNLYYGQLDAYMSAKETVVSFYQKKHDEQFERMNTFYTHSAFFVKDDITEHTYPVYTFFDPETGDKGTIHCMEGMTLGFSFYSGHLKKHLKYHLDRDCYPEWFLSLVQKKFPE